jgi:hypothetical protein
MGYSMAYTADLRKYESVYLLGRGTTPVEWKDEAVPAGTRSSVIDSAMPSKN